MAPSVAVPLAFVAVGALCVALAIPLLKRRIPRNGWYGLRTPSSLSSDAVWYEANARSAVDLLRLGVVVASSAVVLGLAGLHPGIQVSINTGVLLVGVVVYAGRGILIARRLACRK